MISTKHLFLLLVLCLCTQTSGDGLARFSFKSAALLLAYWLALLTFGQMRKHSNKEVRRPHNCNLQAFGNVEGLLLDPLEGLATWKGCGLTLRQLGKVAA